MFGFLVVIGFLWLLLKLIGLSFRLTWGFTRIFATVLMGLATPLLIICFILWAGVFLLIPVLVLCLAFGILKTGK